MQILYNEPDNDNTFESSDNQNNIIIGNLHDQHDLLMTFQIYLLTIEVG